MMNFSVEEVRFEKLIDDSTALILMKVCSSGDNAHGLPFSKKTMVEAAERSLRGKPIVAKYSQWDGDFGTHDKVQIPLGFFVEPQKFKYVDNEDGTTSLFAYAVMWKTYVPEQYDLFVKKYVGGESATKPVSMEIFVHEKNKGYEGDSQKTEITNFSFKGVTILGDKYKPASPGAYAEMVVFSNEKRKQIEEYFAVDADKIIDTEDSRNYLKKYYSQLGLSTENFEEKEDKEVKSKEEEINKEEQGTFAEGENTETKETLSTEEGFEQSKSEDSSEAMAEETSKEEDKKEYSDDEKSEDEDSEEENYEKKYADISEKFAQKEAEFEELKSLNETYFAELEILRAYKSEKDNAEKVAKIEETFSKVAHILPKEVIDEYRQRIGEVEFDGVAKFCNEIKARVVDFVELTKDSQKDSDRFGIQTPPESETKTTNWW
jgi:hypothetical protein